jgi:hypothetical protein
MFQIVWMLSLLPDWFWTLILTIGIVGIIAAWILKRVPMISIYRIPILIISVICLVIGVFVEGLLYNEKIYEEEKNRLEAVIQKYKDQSANTNVEIQEKIVEKTQIIEKRGKDIIKTIEVPGPERVKEITKDMSDDQRKAYEAQIEELKRASQCTLPPILVDAHNKAAAKPEGDKK